MAKQTEKVAYITLGEGAVSFYDPAKGRLGLALRGGHVDKTDEEAYNLYTNGEGVEVSKAIEEIEEDIISLSKPQLVSRAKDLGSNLTKNKLKGMTVSQLNDLISSETEILQLLRPQPTLIAELGFLL